MAKRSPLPQQRRYGGFLSATKPRSGAVVRVLLFAVLLAGFLSGAMLLQHARLKGIESSRPYIDTLFLPRAEYAKLLAFGYDLFMADFLYVRSIQAFGGQWNKAVKNYEPVCNFFGVITELDPHFIEAYEFGSLVIGEEGRNPRGAMELNAKGWLKNPGKYRPSYLNAYIAGWTLENPILAKVWVYRALKAKDHPEWLRRWINYFDLQSGRYEAALENWIREFLGAVANRENHLIVIAVNQIRDVGNKWNSTTLHNGLKSYRSEHDGQVPATLEELAAAGYLKDYRTCLVLPLIAMLEAIAASPAPPAPGVEERLMKACIREISGAPPSPFGPAEEGHHYFIRKDIKPENYDAAVEKRYFIITAFEAREYTSGLLQGLRARIDRFREEENRCPASLDEMFPEEGWPYVDAETGKPFDYNPETGAVHSPSYPDL